MRAFGSRFKWMPRDMTKKQNTRRIAIINELSRLSRNGWENAKPVDYAPLESELATLSKDRAA
jgi:hypothetical protein